MSSEPLPSQVLIHSTGNFGVFPSLFVCSLLVVVVVVVLGGPKACE